MKDQNTYLLNVGIEGSSPSRETMIINSYIVVNSDNKVIYSGENPLKTISFIYSRKNVNIRIKNSLSKLILKTILLIQEKLN